MTARQAHCSTFFDRVETAFRCAGLLILSCWLITAGSRTTRAESSDELVPSWSISQGDCELRVIRRRQEARTNRTPESEHFQLRCGTGSRAFASFPLIDQPPIISELGIRLHLKSDRAGLQLFVRAVLPRSIGPEGPKTVMLPGPKLSEVGQWQSLRLADLSPLLEKYVRVSRINSGRRLDTREAFIDMVVVNVYGGRGTTNVWLPTPKVDGALVSRSPIEAELASIDRLPTPENHAAKVEAGVLTVDGRPVAPRVVRPHGESWTFLKSLGFNTIWLESAATAKQMAAAEQLEMWLVARLPKLQDMAVLNSSHYRRVIAWDLRYDRATLKNQQQLVDAIRDACGTNCKPLICSTQLDPKSASRFSNIIVHQRPILGTTLPTASYGLWLGHRISDCLLGTAHWATLSTQPPPKVQQQILTLSSSLRSSSHNQQPPRFAHDPQQIWHAASIALAHGARGLCIVDSKRLDGDDWESKLRAESLRQLNLRLAVLAPWLVSGQPSKMYSTEPKDLQLGVFTTDRTALAIPVQSSRGEQFCSSAATLQDTRLTVPGGSDAANVYLLRNDGLNKIPSRRVAGGTTFNVDDLRSTIAILVTADDRIAGNISATLRRLMPKTIANQQIIAESLLANTQTKSTTKMINVSSTIRGNRLATAQRLLQQSSAASKTGKLSLASRHLTACKNILYQHRRKAWDDAYQNRDLSYTPLAGGFATVTLFNYWQRRFPQVARGVNLLNGGDMEDLELLLKTGWTANQNPTGRLRSSVAISSEGRNGHGLRMESDATNSDGVVPLASVTTAMLNFEPGQQVRIDGWLKASPAAGSNQLTATISDSWAGTSLAYRRQATSGWQPFTIFRVGTGEPLQITCALTGPGELLVDDLLVSPLANATVANR